MLLAQADKSYSSPMDRIVDRSVQENFFLKHKMEFAVAIGVIVVLGIAYLECHRRFEDRMNDIGVMKCNTLQCKPDDQGKVPLLTNDGVICACPPSKIASRMNFPTDIFGNFDYFKEAHRVCNEELAISTNEAKEDVIKFCKNINYSIKLEDSQKGFYRKALEAIRLI